MTPAWILDISAALMLVVAAVSAARLAAARPGRSGTGTASSDTDIAHLLMAVAMAGMLASSLTTLPNAAWEVIFAMLTAWFGYRVARDARANGARALAGGHCAPHLVHSAAMLYMFLALVAPATGGGSGMGAMNGTPEPAMPALQYPILALAFGLILVGYSIWDLDQLSGRRYSLTSPGLSLAAAAVPALAGAESASVAFSGPTAAGNSAPADTLAGAAPAGRAADGGTRASRPASRRFLLSAGMTVGCRIAMGVTMAFMLFIMI